MNHKTIVHYRRFHGYDYSRGAVLFITFGLVARPAVFGRVVCGPGACAKVAYGEVGRAALETMQLEMRRTRDLVVHRFGLMPDHVHLRLYVRPGTVDPLVKIGALVRNFKRWSKWKAARLGCRIEWEANYHDRICVSADVIDLVDKYIANNPLKWALMHGPNPPLRVIEPLDSPRLPSSEWWTAAGAVDLLDGSRRLAGFQLSRSIPASQVEVVVARCLEAVRRGFVPVSTFISPAERALQRALVAAKAPMIRVVPDALATVYRPKADEPQLFAEGRLLLLSRVAAAGRGRSAAWHGINDAIVGLSHPVALKERPAQDGAPGVASAQDGAAGMASAQDGAAGVASAQDGAAGMASAQDGAAGMASAQDGAAGMASVQARVPRVASVATGAAVYVVLNRATGRVEWRFRSASKAGV